MSRVVRYARPVLSEMPASDPGRTTRDLLRKSTEKFFLPFTSTRRSSADLASYRFRENLSNVFVPAIIDKHPELAMVGSTAASSLSSPSSSSFSSTDAKTLLNINNSNNNNNSLNDASNGAAAAVVNESKIFCAAQLNGEVGNSRVFENLFHVLLCGFDVVHVSVENRDGCSMLSSMQDPCHFRGFLMLAHTRPFLGWQPEFIEQPRARVLSELSPNSVGFDVRAPRSAFRLHAREILPFAHSGAEPGIVRLPMTLRVPFSTHVEGAFSKQSGGGFLLSHMNLRVWFANALKTPPEERDTFGMEGNQLDSPPAAVLKVLECKQSLKILAGLRRMGVRPELITAETLLNAASAQKSGINEALGTA